MLNIDRKYYLPTVLVLIVVFMISFYYILVMTNQTSNEMEEVQTQEQPTAEFLDTVPTTEEETDIDEAEGTPLNRITEDLLNDAEAEEKSLIEEDSEVDTADFTNPDGYLNSYNENDF